VLLSKLGIGTLIHNEGQDGHSGTVAAGDSPRGHIALSPVEVVRCDSGGDIHLRELQTQRDDGHSRKTSNGVGLGVDANEETGQKGQVKRG
jgi:hypothetical protein